MKLAAAAFLMVFMISGAHALDFLVLDRDDAVTLDDPLGGGMVGSEYGIVRSLQNLGHSVTTVPNLPVDISGYDIIFICTGWYGG